MVLKSGKNLSFDLVIGADGLHSNVRKLVFGEKEQVLQNLGYYVSVFTLPNYLKLDHWELGYSAADKIINIYSTGKTDEARAFFLFRAADLKYDYQDINGQKQIMLDYFSNEGSLVSKVLSFMPVASDFYFDSVSQVHMKNLFKGRVCLIGDAGYCASPASGQGTSLALIGAYVLAGELMWSKGDYQLAFESYQKEVPVQGSFKSKIGVIRLKKPHEFLKFPILG